MNKTKRERPSHLPSHTYKTKTGCGNLYVTITYDKDGAFEVFLKLGRCGSCSAAFLEAVGKLISIGLHHHVPISEYAEILDHIRCPNQIASANPVFSCVDAVSKVLVNVVPEKKEEPK